MNIPRINLSGVFGALKHVKDLPKILGYLKAAQEYIKLLDAIAESLKQPAANLLFAARKAISALEENAAKTDLNNDGNKLNDMDDKAYRGLEKAIDAVLEFFHLSDDYERLVELDNAVKLK